MLLPRGQVAILAVGQLDDKCWLQRAPSLDRQSGFDKLGLGQSRDIDILVGICLVIVQLTPLVPIHQPVLLGTNRTGGHERVPIGATVAARLAGWPHACCFAPAVVSRRCYQRARLFRR